jgi:sterol desaturase/sphingolipid hydroxylase (fatty acid hydroxylase superfamily)
MITSLFAYLLAPEYIFFLFGVIFILRSIFFFILEHFFVAHPFNRREVILSDMVSMLFYFLVIYPFASYFSNHIGVQGTFLNYFLFLPLSIRVLLYFIIGDFFHYWIHRIMHHSLLWRVHMWHHSSTHMSFMSGVKASLLDSTFVNLAFIFAWPILGIPSYHFIIGMLIFTLFLNDWMHLNIRGNFKFLEKIVITPRYHHIHHSLDMYHQNKNLSAIFPIWDKLFGTYSDPDLVEGKLTFGLGKKIKTPRLIIGV